MNVQTYEMCEVTLELHVENVFKFQLYQWPLRIFNIFGQNIVQIHFPWIGNFTIRIFRYAFILLLDQCLSKAESFNINGLNTCICLSCFNFHEFIVVSAQLNWPKVSTLSKYIRYGALIYTYKKESKSLYWENMITIPDNDGICCKK